MSEKSHVVVVDDNHSIADMCELILCSDGYDAVKFYNSESALEYLLKEDTAVDLVLLDYDIDRMNGATILYLVKQAKPDVKSILMSGLLSKVQESVIDEFDAVFDKPFDIAALLTAVETLLG